MAELPIFLVRHGRYSKGVLNEEGRTIDGPNARDALLSRGVGRGALVLTSDLPRAVETAEIIAEGIADATIIQSKRIAEGGNEVRGVRNLDTFIAKALEEAEVTRGVDQHLVVVSHAPMLSVAKGMGTEYSDENVQNGEVVEYTPGTWNNPDFVDYLETFMERELAPNQ